MFICVHLIIYDVHLPVSYIHVLYICDLCFFIKKHVYLFTFIYKETEAEKEREKERDETSLHMVVS